VLFGSRRKKEARRALRDENLQKALNKASGEHYQKYLSTKNSMAWQDYKDRARAIRQECVPKLQELIQKFSEEATKAGANVYRVRTAEEALVLVEKIASEKKAKLVVKSKSMVSEEIGLNEHLAKKGYQVVETDLGEWIIQLAGERPSHITAPALHKTKEEVAEILSRHLQKPIPADIREIVKVARQELRKYFIQADIGISGANLAIAESGTLVLVSNEGNARLVTSLPPVHIALLTTEKFVDTMEQATTLLKVLVTASAGLKLTSYVSFITGPSRTSDIEKELVLGAHGPQEVHIIILDNGRLEASQDKDLEETLYCLKCGGCMLVCPVFQAVGGYVYGGPVYPGGIGVLLTAITRSIKDASKLLDFCADCKKCQDFCPVGIPTADLLLKLKHKKGPSLGERLLSNLFRQKSLAEAGAKFFSIFQKPLQKNGYLRSLPFPWIKGKSIPVLNLKKISWPENPKGQKVYFFQGCLVKFFFPEIQESVFKTLSHFGFKVVSPSDQVCCGAPSLHLANQKDVKALALKNLESFEKEKPDFILTVCPAGNSILKNVYPEVVAESSAWRDKIFDFTEFLAKKGLFPTKAKPGQMQEIYYHYPCHYVNDLKLRDIPQKLLQALGYNFKEEKEPLACCGFCGVFSLKNPEISEHLWEKKKQKILEQNVCLIATDCPGCIFQFKSHSKKDGPFFQVFHTAELSAKGIDRIKNGLENS
jgi:iron-sulfur cluster protein